MSGPENPSAFPVIDAGHGIAFSEGMTLRDWFAGQALIGAAMETARSGDTLSDCVRGIVVTSYQLADAMLAERAKGGAA